MMRVLYLGFYAELGGAEMHMLRTVDGLDRRLVDPIVAVRAEGPLTAALRAREIRTVVVPSLTYLARGARHPVTACRNLVGLIRGVSAIGSLIRSADVDLIHACSEPAIKYGACVSYLTGVPAVCTLHDALLPPYGWLHRRAIAWCLAHGYARTVTPSEANRALALAAGVPPDAVVTIPNGVDIAQTPTRSRAAVRAGLGVSPTTVVLGQVGRFAPIKGHDVLLRALPLILQSHSDVLLLFVGDALFEGERAHRDAVLGSARAAGLVDRLHVVGWTDTIADWYEALDVLVHPAVAHDTLPTVILEAMAYGLPVVASAVGGIVEIVEDGVTGLVVPPKDEVALAQAISTLLGDPVRRRAMGEAGRRRVATDFTLDRHRERLMSVYESVMTGRAGRAGGAARADPVGPVGAGATRVMRGALSNGVARTAAIVIAAGQAAFLTRHLSLSEYGVVTALAFLGVTGLFSAAIGAHVGNALARTRAQVGPPDDADQANASLFSSAVLLLSVACAVGLAGLLALWPFVPWSHVLNIANPTLLAAARHSVALSVVAQLVAMPASLALFAFRAYDETEALAIQTAAIALLTFGIAVAATVAARTLPDLLPVVAAAPFLANLLVSAVGTAVLLRRRRWSVRSRPIRPTWTRATRLCLQAVPFATAGTLFGLLTTSGSYAVSLTQGFSSAAVVDLYWKLLFAALVVEGEMLHPLWPVYARYELHDDRLGVRRMLGLSTVMAIVLVVVVSIGVGAFGEWAIHLLTGRTLVLSRAALGGLAGYAVAFAALQSVMTYFNAASRVLEAIPILAVGLAVTAAASLAGGARFGIAGATAGLAIGLAIVTLALVFRVLRVTQARHPRRGSPSLAGGSGG
jgi:glycosyltransferase involved in cell wall biosynthesis/O-antigen/teichoic acid export membrane protein